MATYEDWKVGDLAVRKNRLCRIKKIHFDEYPPHVSVEMLDDNNEVGTEFSKLRHATHEEIESVNCQDPMNGLETRLEGNTDVRNANINDAGQTDTDEDTDASVKTEPKILTNTRSGSKMSQRKTENNSNVKNSANIKNSKMDTDHNIGHSGNIDGRSNATANNEKSDNAGNTMNFDENTNDINGEPSQHIEVHSSPSLHQASTKTHSQKKKAE